MPLRKTWQTAKDVFEKAFGKKLTELVKKQDLGPMLDTVDSAQNAYDNASGTNPTLVAQRKTALTNAKKAASAALVQYQQTIQFLHANLATPQGPQRTAQLGALNNFLTSIMQMHLSLK